MLGAEGFSHQHPCDVNVVCTYFMYLVRRELLAAPSNVKIRPGDFFPREWKSVLNSQLELLGLHFADALRGRWIRTE